MKGAEQYSYAALLRRREPATQAPIGMNRSQIDTGEVFMADFTPGNKEGQAKYKSNDSSDVIS